MIVNSLLDTDLYKLTMMQGVLHQFPWANVEYEFKCRDSNIDFSQSYEDINREVDHLCSLRFTSDELDYLRSLRFIKEDFVQFLRLFQLNRKFITIITKNDQFSISIKGPWLHTILFEVPVLAIVNECYFKKKEPEPNLSSAKHKLFDKIELVKQSNKNDLHLKFSDFGTRRRFSFKWQDYLIGTLKSELPENFTGTSNVHFAKKHGITPVGTMAHEWLMASQALGPKLLDGQKFALEHWAKEYRGDLGIALSDVVGFTAFLNDFDMYFAKLFDGCRHDSGDPISWGNRLIKHYEMLKINPKSKIAIFSDGLTFPEAIRIATYFNGKIITAFGIGTNLTNDVSGIPIQIVIKMTHCQGSPVAKLSDSPGKQMCNDDRYLDYLTSLFKRGNK